MGAGSYAAVVGSSRPLLVLLGFVAVATPMVTAACRKKTIPASEVEGAPRCDLVLSSAEASVRAALERAQERCSSDDECVEVAPAKCMFRCAGYAVHRKAARDFASAVGRVSDDQCRAWDANDCDRVSPQPIASCARSMPACQDSKCATIYPPELDARQCAKFKKRVEDQLAAARAKATRDLHCETDRDCDLAGDPTCLHGCGGPVIARASRGGYEEAMRAIEPTCKEWTEAPCYHDLVLGAPMPTCPAPLPRCVQGTCVDARAAKK